VNIDRGPFWDLRLSAEELARIEETRPATPVAGSRYDDHQMRMLDSEKETHRHTKFAASSVLPEPA
jgi:hypothetical protein